MSRMRKRLQEKKSDAFRRHASRCRRAADITLVQERSHSRGRLCYYWDPFSQEGPWRNKKGLTLLQVL